MRKGVNMSEPIIITRLDGGKLHGIYYKLPLPITSERKLIILNHGFTGEKTEWGRFNRTAERLNQAGYDAILFDFSGSGDNVREPILLSKQVRDLEAVYAWGLKQGYGKVTSIGLSFGGLTSLKANLPGRTVAVFWAPAFYLYRIISHKTTPLIYAFLKFVLRHWKKTISLNMGVIPTAPLIIDINFISEIENANAPETLKNWNIPTLIVQGAKDSDVNPKWTRECASFLPSTLDKKYIEIPNATHNFKDQLLEEFIDVTIEWLKLHF
jgi:pimeloyl-ACP methyl ester carboxylesterase